MSAPVSGRHQLISAYNLEATSPKVNQDTAIFSKLIKKLSYLAQIIEIIELITLKITMLCHN
ncbi:MAG: hypothetical protein ACJA0N_000301 [Pseudohongiellaceae bacterium]|jgi:hypothetical protein